jgi:putative two-component system response regulator
VESIVQVLDSTISARDPYTVSHQQRVSQVSVAIAAEMGLGERCIKNLEIAAKLHDFGKISIPMSILSKPGKLSFHEMALVRAHPMMGAEMLKPLQLPTYTFLTIIQHHERMDGTGYPFGLSGEDILLEARILAVADVVEAISSHRPYRPSLGIKHALDELSQHRGTLYDPVVVDAFVRQHARANWNTILFPKVTCHNITLHQRAA